MGYINSKSGLLFQITIGIIFGMLTMLDALDSCSEEQSSIAFPTFILFSILYFSWLLYKLCKSNATKYKNNVQKTMENFNMKNEIWDWDYDETTGEGKIITTNDENITDWTMCSEKNIKLASMAQEMAKVINEIKLLSHDSPCFWNGCLDTVQIRLSKESPCTCYVKDIKKIKEKLERLERI